MLVKTRQLGVIHGAGKQGRDVARLFMAPDQLIAAYRDPVQLKPVAVLRRIGAQRIQPPAAPPFVEDELGMSAEQALQLIRIERDQIVGAQRAARFQQLQIAAQRGIKIFKMLGRLGIAHLQRHGQLTQQRVRLQRPAAERGGIDMQPAPDAAAGGKFPAR